MDHEVDLPSSSGSMAMADATWLQTLDPNGMSKDWLGSNKPIGAPIKQFHLSHAHVKGEKQVHTSKQLTKLLKKHASQNRDDLSAASINDAFEGHKAKSEAYIHDAMNVALDEDDEEMLTHLQKVSDAINNLPDRELVEDTLAKPRGFWKNAASIYSANINSGMEETAAKTKMGGTGSMDLEPAFGLEMFLTPASMDKSQRQKEFRTLTMANAAKGKRNDFDNHAAVILGAGVIAGSAQKMKLAVGWAPKRDHNGNIVKVYSHTEYCHQDGVTWEREDKFQDGGSLTSSPQSVQAYLEFQMWYASSIHHGNKGWPFKKASNGGNDKEYVVIAPQYNFLMRERQDPKTKNQEAKDLRTSGINRH